MPLVDCTDWPRVRAMTDADIEHDADSPSTTTADWDGAVLKQGGVAVGRVRARGPNKRPTKEQVAIRLSPDVLSAFRADGPGWQTRIDAALRDWLKTHRTSAGN
ncbi:BrnA antitoxin family protein [uncultured Thiodictyon sp.]|uniref:BrnA antitoxin family protein n=2 Tax=uncultured Thiodictyon sp. TaxID=1846217 RepID=UPI0025EF5A85|nr:BrnA antitoxin family protein [uncultured Thiodictyon sp.]